MRDFFKSLGELLFPPVCLSCGKHLQPPTDNVHFCDICAQDIVLINEPLCSRCGRFFPDSAAPSHLCGYCLSHQWHFNKARAIFLYCDPVRKLIHDFKYRGNTEALETFMNFADRLPHLEEIIHPDLIIPVPLHKKRLRQRGFNQAAIFAKTFFADRKKLINFDLLIRHRWTETQTGLSGPERRKNLKGSFSLTKENEACGKKILLVDDVFTTGTTVNECSRVLKKNGAINIDVLTLARVKDY